MNTFKANISTSANISDNSDTVIFVLHEIYGINEHIKLACKHLKELGCDIVCPNLIDKEIAYDYSQTKIAYNHFIKHIGFELAADKVIKQIREVRENYKYVFIIGYSVGATVAWLCSAKDNLCDGIIGYYGSRIRDYTELSSKCATLLFIPSDERALNNGKLIDCLTKIGADIHVLKGDHGFCDQYGSRYNKDSEKTAEALVHNFLNKLRI